MISKSITLLMTSMIRVNRTIPICNTGPILPEPEVDRDKRYVATLYSDDPERVAWIWCLFFTIIAPDIFAFGRSARICFFKTYTVPSKFTFVTVN